MKTLCDEWSKNEDGLIPSQSPASAAVKGEAKETRSRGESENSGSTDGHPLPSKLSGWNWSIFLTDAGPRLADLRDRMFVTPLLRNP